jgi:hypothetical protein
MIETFVDEDEKRPYWEKRRGGLLVDGCNFPNKVRKRMKEVSWLKTSEENQDREVVFLLGTEF